MTSFDVSASCFIGPNTNPQSSTDIDNNIKHILQEYEKKFKIFEFLKHGQKKKKKSDVDKDVSGDKILKVLQEKMEVVLNAKLSDLYKWDLSSLLMIISSFFGSKYVLLKNENPENNSMSLIDISEKVKFPLHTIILMCYASACMAKMFGEDPGQDLLSEKFKKLKEYYEDWATRMIDELYNADTLLAENALKIDYREKLAESLSDAQNTDPPINGVSININSENHSLIANQPTISGPKKLSSYRKYLDRKFGGSKEIMSIAYNAKAMKFLSTRCCQNYIHSRNFEKKFYVTTKWKFRIHTIVRVIYIFIYSYLLCRFPTSNQTNRFHMTSKNGTYLWFFVIAVLSAQFFTTSIKLIDALHKQFNANTVSSIRFVVIPVVFIFEVIRLVGFSNSYICSYFGCSETAKKLLTRIDAVFIPIFSEILYCFFFVVATVSSLRYFQNFTSLGFFTHLLKKMYKTVAMFLFIFCTFWFVLAVLHVSISRTLLVTNNSFVYSITEKGKFEVFGEVAEADSNGSIDECKNYNSSILNLFDMEYREASCLIRSSIIPFLLFSYMFVTGILLMNLLTAQLTKEYEKESERSKDYTGFLKYELLSKIESKMILPPPFSWIYVIIRFIALVSHCCQCNFLFDFIANYLDGHPWGTVRKTQLINEGDTICRMHKFIARKPDNIWKMLKEKIDEYSRKEENDVNMKEAKLELEILINGRVEVNFERSMTRMGNVFDSNPTDVSNTDETPLSITQESPRLERSSTLQELENCNETSRDATPLPTDEDLSHLSRQTSQYFSCSALSQS